MSHLAKFPRACHQSPALSEEQVTQLVRQRKLAQHAGAWAPLSVLADFVDNHKRHFVDNDVLFGDDEEDDAYEPPEDEEWMPSDALEPVVPRLLPSICYMFDEATCPAWQAQMVHQVVPALADCPGSGRYAYVVHVSSPFLPACEMGCPCLQGNQGCHFIVRNNQPCKVYDIEVPKDTPLYMCAASCVIIGPTNNSMSPPLYMDEFHMPRYVVDKRWVRVAKKGVQPRRVRFVRFGVGKMRRQTSLLCRVTCGSGTWLMQRAVARKPRRGTARWRATSGT